MVTPLQDFQVANRLLIKFCRASALLPWLTAHIAFQDPPVHLVRHPLAVAASQLQFGAWNTPSTLSALTAKDPRRDLHGTFLSDLESPLEILVATWCLHNAATLRVPPSDASWLTIHYEHLLLDPRPELARIFDAWGEQPDASVWKSVDQPSATTKDARFLDQPDKQLDKWRASFSDADLARAQAILDHFGVDVYTTASSRPQTPSDAD